jgi:hypothetical protein
MAELLTEDAASRQAAELRLIATDIHWAWRFGWDAVGVGAAIAIPALCLTSPLSLIVYEARRYLAKVDPLLPLRYSVFIEQARHRIKLFDDNQRGMEGIINYAGVVITAHRSHFVALTGDSSADDLGLYEYRGRLICTSHVAQFNIGTQPDTIGTEDRSETSRGIGVELGQYIRSLGDPIKAMFQDWDWDGRSFLGTYDEREVDLIDVVANNYYGARSAAGLSVGAILALDICRCNLNTIEVLLSADPSPWSLEFLFKIRFITLHHILNGLTQLRADQEQNLTQGQLDLLRKLEEHPTTQLLSSQPGRSLRNALVHYRIAYQVPTSVLDYTRPLAGLVDFYLSQDFSVVAAEIQAHAERVAEALDGWAARPAI